MLRSVAKIKYQQRKQNYEILFINFLSEIEFYFHRNSKELRKFFNETNLLNCFGTSVGNLWRRKWLKVVAMEFSSDLWYHLACKRWVHFKVNNEKKSSWDSTFKATFSNKNNLNEGRKSLRTRFRPSSVYRQSKFHNKESFSINSCNHCQSMWRM